VLLPVIARRLPIKKRIVSAHCPPSSSLFLLFFFFFSLPLLFFFLLFSLSLAATAGVPRARVFPFSRLERSAATRDKANGVDTYYWVRDIQGYIYIFRGCICSYPARGPKSILPHKLSPPVAVVASPSCMNRRATRRGTFAVNETTSLFSESTLEKSIFKLRFYSLVHRRVGREALEIFTPLTSAATFCLFAAATRACTFILENTVAAGDTGRRTSALHFRLDIIRVPMSHNRRIDRNLIRHTVNFRRVRALIRLKRRAAAPGGRRV